MSDQQSPREPVRLQGFHAVKHAVRFGARLLRLVVVDREAAAQLAAQLAPDLAGVIDTAEEISAAEFVQLFSHPHPTGVGAVAERAVQPEVVDVGTLVGSRGATVLLDDPRHLGNVGAVVRATAALGGAGVLTLGEVDPWADAALRGSAGLHYAIPVHRLDAYAAGDVDLVAFDPDGDDLSSTALPERAVLAFGSERAGLSAALGDAAAVTVAIPMQPEVSSMNLATSVAVGLYEWTRQQRG